MIRVTVIITTFVITATTPTIDIFPNIPTSFLKMKKRLRTMAPRVMPILTQFPLLEDMYPSQCTTNFIDLYLHCREPHQNYQQEVVVQI